MKKNKKLYDITFKETHQFNSGSIERTILKKTTDKDEIKDIIRKHLFYSNIFQFKVDSVKVKSHDLIDVKGRTFISKDTENLGKYTVIYPNEKFNPSYVVYKNKNVIDLNLNLIQKANQK
ncbi:hypothetical protein HDR60_00010 [bacterium]|nr:hypothetical protein [bacterium]